MKIMQIMHRGMEDKPIHKQIAMAEHHLEMMENMMPKMKEKMTEMKDKKQNHSHSH
jgi:archaellum component FlaC